MKKYLLFLLLLLSVALQAMNTDKERKPDSDDDIFFSYEISSESYESDSDNESPLIDKLLKAPLTPRKLNVPNALAKTVAQEKQ
jgi:hypothetical protein